MENQPFLLVELEDLSSIYAPLKSASRIKYTCFNVSNTYLIFGATSGSLYVFRREPCCFLQLLPNKEGSVINVAISPDEKLIAFATVKGTVCILERSSHGAKPIVTASEHQNEQITCLQWNERNDELFVGDNSGKVSIVSLSIFPTKSMFQTPSFVLMQLDSKIVQMDFNSNMLLVSTLTKCYICDTTREIFRQVGHKLRDGEFGACIFNTQCGHDNLPDSSKLETEKNLDCSNLSHLKLLCARPGSRVWEVSIDGTVISTHHFKEALAVPPKKIYFLNNLSSQNSDFNNSIINGSCMIADQINTNFVEQSFNFQKLYVLLSKFLFTFKSDGIYIFDPQKAVVILWNNEITNITDVACINDVIYVWSGYGKMYALNLVPLEKFIVRLYFQKKFFEVGKLCLEFENYLMNQTDSLKKLHVLQDLDVKLKLVENSEKLRDRLRPLLIKINEIAKTKESQNAQKLKSGIYLVNNKEPLGLDDRHLGKQLLLRPSFLNFKGRSHSVSPERFQNGEKRHGSTSSLPDLVKEEDFNCASEIVVNGNKEKNLKVPRANPKLRTENVVKVCKAIKASGEPSHDLIFNLFDQILELNNSSNLGADNNLDLVQSLPLKLYFKKEDIDLITDLFHSSLRSKLIFEWLPKFPEARLTNAVKCFPEFLVKNHSIRTLEVDYQLSKTLQLFSNILNENEIIDTLRKTKLDCYYASLQKILDVYQDSSLSSVSLSNLDLANISSPKVLNIVYFLLSVGQVDACAKNSHKINLQDVFYLILKFEDESKKSGKPSDVSELQSHTLFLSYLEKSAERNELILNCSSLIENYIISCLENINSAATCVRKSNCGCGFPCPGRRPSVTMFPDIGHALVDKMWPKNLEKCLEICSRVPSLWRYLIYKRRSEPLDSVLSLLVQSGEIEELETRSSEVSLDVLDTCFGYLIQLKKGNCLNCGGKIDVENEPISWTDFGMLCTKLSNPRETLLLFQKYATKISSQELNQVLFQGLIFSCIIENHCKGLRKNVVDLLTGRGLQESYRVPVLSQEFQKEILHKKPNNNESASHHWGVKINFKTNCTVCSLPLDTKVLISESGLVVFNCSHAFHSACLRKINLECPLCKISPATEAGSKLCTTNDLKDVLK